MPPPSNHDGRNPLDGLAAALMSNVQQFQGNLQHLQRGMQELGQRASAVVQHIQQHVAQHLQTPAPQAPLLASVSARLAAASSALQRSAVQPVLDLAFNPEELKFRLSEVPVYTVVDGKKQFVLVSAEGEKPRQLALFFFKEADALAFIETLKAEDPKLGKQARVLPTRMDLVYDLNSRPRESTDLQEGVEFKFVPDAEQVEKAMQLYHHAGVPTDEFNGVPLFQAEGLTVKKEDKRFTPLFFSKNDLDVALGSANVAREQEMQADARSKADRAREELQAAEAELASAPERERKAAQRKVEAAAKRVERYEARLAELRQQQRRAPRVDVGSLEEVIAKMEMDEKGEWGDVMFIPPNAMSDNSSSPAQQQKVQKVAKKK